MEVVEGVKKPCGCSDTSKPISSWTEGPEKEFAFCNMSYVFCPETTVFGFLLELQAFKMFWRGEFEKLQPKMINIVKWMCRKSFGISEFRFDTCKESWRWQKERRREKDGFHLYMQYGRHMKTLKPKDHQQVLGICQAARGMESVLARSSQCLCARLKAMRRDRERQQTKLKNKLTSPHIRTGHATALAVPLQV